MRTFGAVVLALFCAVGSFFIVGFFSCLVALYAESVALGYLAVCLAIAAAIGGGYLGAKMVLVESSPGEQNPDVNYWANGEDKKEKCDDESLLS
jgi:hypothetical protein